MNKFSKLTQKLVNNSLWCSTITYIPRSIEKDGLVNTFIENTPINLNIVLKSLDKSLIDNTYVFPTDLSFVVDKLSIGNPTKNDLIIYNNQTYKIVEIHELGVLNNEPIGYELIIRMS